MRENLEKEPVTFFAKIKNGRDILQKKQQENFKNTARNGGKLQTTTRNVLACFSGSVSMSSRLSFIWRDQNKNTTTAQRLKSFEEEGNSS